MNVFESAIDAMSYASMVLESGEDWTQQTYLSLGGVYKNQNRLPIALEKYLSGYGEPQEIILRLDRDEVGRNATKDILSMLKSPNAKAVFCEKGKDYNEFLMIQKELFSSDRSYGKEMDR